MSAATRYEVQAMGELATDESFLRALRILTVPIECTDDLAIALLERSGFSNADAVRLTTEITELPFVVARPRGWYFMPTTRKMLQGALGRGREFHALLTTMLDLDIGRRAKLPRYLQSPAGHAYHRVNAQGGDLDGRYRTEVTRLRGRPRDLRVLAVLIADQMREFEEQGPATWLPTTISPLALEGALSALEEDERLERVRAHKTMGSGLSIGTIAVVVVVALGTLVATGAALGWYP